MGWVGELVGVRVETTDVDNGSQKLRLTDSGKRYEAM